MLAWKQLSNDRQLALATSAKECGAWMESRTLTAVSFGTCSHFSCFRTIRSGFSVARTERAVVKAFTELSPAEIGALTPTQLDEQLAAIRQKQTAEHGTADLDFYSPPLVGVWKDDDEEDAAAPELPSPAPQTEVRYWVEKTLVEGRPDRSTGDHRVA
jgi:hypothetical protein